MHIFDHVGLDPVEMNAEMIDGKRYYLTPSGNQYPSITTVISNNAKKQAGLAKWRKRVGMEVAQAKTTRASGRGTRYHKLVEDYINNELDRKKYKDMPLPWIMFDSSVPILNKINKVYIQEAALYSDYLQVAGRVDCIGEYDGELAIIDFKTSAEPKKEAWLYDYYVQETAYACCLQELYGITVKKLVTIVACENSDVQVSVVTPKKEYFLRLQEYITEYQEKYAGKSRG